ncbi:MAG: class I SAM-dependent methyltransferase [Chloroflexota bacterium]
MGGLPWRRRLRQLASNLPLIGWRWDAVASRRWLFALLPPGSEGAEIGVWQGDFSAAILAAVRPRRLHLIDPWRSAADAAHAGALFDRPQAAMDTIADEVAARFAPDIAQGRVVVHRATSSATAHVLPDASLDWVYVDGDHAYEAVRNDIELFARKLRPGGILAGDDYRARGMYGGGVKRAVDEVLASGALQLVARRGRQFVLLKPPAA